MGERSFSCLRSFVARIHEVDREARNDHHDEAEIIELEQRPAIEREGHRLYRPS
jgi:hypothetical protein